MDNITLMILAALIVTITALLLFKRFKRKKYSYNDYLIDSFLWVPYYLQRYYQKENRCIF